MHSGVTGLGGVAVRWWTIPRGGGRAWCPCLPDQGRGSLLVSLHSQCKCAPSPSPSLCAGALRDGAKSGGEERVGTEAGEEVDTLPWSGSLGDGVGGERSWNEARTTRGDRRGRVGQGRGFDGMHALV